MIVTFGLNLPCAVKVPEAVSLDHFAALDPGSPRRVGFFGRAGVRLRSTPPTTATRSSSRGRCRSLCRRQPRFVVREPLVTFSCVDPPGLRLRVLGARTRWRTSRRSASARGGSTSCFRCVRSRRARSKCRWCGRPLGRIAVRARAGGHEEAQARLSNGRDLPSRKVGRTAIAIVTGIDPIRIQLSGVRMEALHHCGDVHALPRERVRARLGRLRGRAVCRGANVRAFWVPERALAFIPVFEVVQRSSTSTSLRTRRSMTSGSSGRSSRSSPGSRPTRSRAAPPAFRAQGVRGCDRCIVCGAVDQNGWRWTITIHTRVRRIKRARMAVR
jgi:hypothetical protein